MHLHATVVLRGPTVAVACWLFWGRAGGGLSLDKAVQLVQVRQGAGIRGDGTRVGRHGFEMGEDSEDRDGDEECAVEMASKRQLPMRSNMSVLWGSSDVI